MSDRAPFDEWLVAELLESMTPVEFAKYCHRQGHAAGRLEARCCDPVSSAVCECRAAGHRQGAAEERAAIVAAIDALRTEWLGAARREGCSYSQVYACEDIIKRIEDGVHLAPERPR